MSETTIATTVQHAPLSVAFRDGIQKDAEKYLRDMLGTEQGRAAAARVALAFSAAARAAKSPEALYRCSRASIVAAVAMSALTNLMPGGPAPSVWLVPKGDELQWWLSHRGIAALALRAGFQIVATPVHKDDAVRIEFGEVLAHEPDPDRWPGSLDELRGVYVTIRRVADGATLGRPWMPIAAIRRRASSGGPVWKSWPIEQAQKTAIKWCHARGYVPIESAELQMALGAEPQDDTPALPSERPTGRAALGLTETVDVTDPLKPEPVFAREPGDESEVEP